MYGAPLWPPDKSRPVWAGAEAGKSNALPLAPLGLSRNGGPLQVLHARSQGMARNIRDIDLSQQRSLREKIGARVRQVRLALPSEEAQLLTFAKNVGVSNSLLSRVESGKASLGVEVVDRIAEVAGCRPEAITTDDPYPERDLSPFSDAATFLGQARLLGVDGLFPDRASALSHLVPFAEKMRSGAIHITSSSLRGLEQRSEHEFVRKLIEFGRNARRYDVRIIVTDPRLGSAREHQERRPEGSIVREIFTGINWCLNDMGIHHSRIRLSRVSPSLFSIFLLDGAEGRGLINPYPTMRQAFSSYAFTVRRVADQPVGPQIHESYYQANFSEPWQDKRITVALHKGLVECDACIEKEKGGSGYEQLAPYRIMLQRAMETCRRSDAESAHNTRDE